MLAANVFNARLAQANLITKTDFDSKLSSLYKGITQNKTKHLLVYFYKTKHLLDSGYVFGKSHFEEDGTHNYLVFQPIYRYFKVFSVTQYPEYVSEWKSKGLFNESFKAISIYIIFLDFDRKFTPEISSQGTHTARSAKGKFKKYHISEYHNIILFKFHISSVTFYHTSTKLY